MKKTLALLSAVAILPTVTTTLVSCEVIGKGKTADKDNANKYITKVNNAEIKTEVATTLKGKTFKSRQEAVDLIKKTEWKTNGIEKVESTTFTSTNQAGVSIKPILKANFAWELNSGNDFDTSISLNVKEEVDKKILQLTSVKYTSTEEAENKIKNGFKTIDGIDSVDLSWTDEANLKFQLDIKYIPNAFGDLIIRNQITLRKNIDNEIVTTNDQIKSNKYDSTLQAGNQINNSFKSIEGIKSVKFEWIDSVDFEYKVSFTFNDGFYGKDSIGGKTGKNININPDLKTINDNVLKNRYLDIKKAKATIEEAFKANQAVESANLIWIQSTLTYRVNLTYKYGYTGNKYFEGTIILKTNLSDVITSKLNELSKKMYDNSKAAEDDIKLEITKITGITQVSIVATPVNELNETSYTLTPTYDASGYLGNKSFESKYKTKKDITKTITDKQTIFESTKFDSYDQAQQKATEILKSIEGIKTVSYVDTNKSESKINFDIIIKDDYISSIKSISWKIAVNFSKLDPISEQTLSFKQDWSKTKTITVTGSKLDGKKIVAEPVNHELIEVYVNGLQVTIKALKNVSGVVDSQVNLQIENEKESATSFNIKIQGKPEIKVLEENVPDLIKMRIGEQKTIRFKMNYFDPKVNKISAKQSDNDGQTSGEIVLVNSKENTYDLKIKGLKGNNVSGNGKQKMGIYVDDKLLQSFDTQVHAAPIVKSNLNGNPLEIKLNAEIFADVYVDMLDSDDEFYITYEGGTIGGKEEEKCVRATIEHIESNHYKLIIKGIKTNSPSWPAWSTGSQYVSIGFKNEKAGVWQDELWRVRTQVRK